VPQADITRSVRAAVAQVCIAKVREQLRGPRAGAINRTIARVGRILAADRSRLISLDLDGDNAVANDASASPRKIRRNRGDLPIWIDGHALIRGKHADGQSS
jgi:hypothetical protein